MDHGTAQELLTRCEELDDEQLRQLALHLESCTDCRGWVATYDLLTEASTARASVRHLDSEALCAFALESPSLDRDALGSYRDHVAGCRSCSLEVERVRAAVAESVETPVRAPAAARAEEPVRGWVLGQIVHRAIRQPGALALAASVLLLVVALAWLGRGWAPGSSERHLADLEVAETRIVEAEGPIFVETTKVREGVALALESPAVGFGDGFSVSSGAQLIVGEELPPRRRHIDHSKQVDESSSNS